MPDAAFDDRPRLALDTEFVWTRTYHARLGLVQAAFSGPRGAAAPPLYGPPAVFQVPEGSTPEERAALLVDPLVADPAPLAATLADAGTVKILHDAMQDLRHLCRWTGCRAPVSVFDTALAAGFCGLPASLSLAALVKETTGVELAKTETRTDWLRRPLSPEQLRYAAQDVAWLDGAARELARRAAARGTYRWMMEEMREFDDTSRYAPAPYSEAWRRVKAPFALRRDPAAAARLKALAAWREETAERRDLPRKWIVADEVLVSAALRPPRSPQALGPRAVPPSFVSGFFAALRSAAAAAPEEDLRETRNLSPEEAECVKDETTALLAKLAAKAETLGVAPVLLATRAEATAWVLDPANPSHPLNRGWRREALGGG